MSAAGRIATSDTRRPWSLWEMLELRLKPLLDAQDVLGQWSFMLHNDPKFTRRPLTRAQREIISKQLQPLAEQLEAHEFDMCSQGVERLRETLVKHDSASQIVSTVDDLRRRVLDQLQSIFCIVLTKSEQNLYQPKTPPFGSLVETNFPSANEDIYEASKCLALDRSTACVMHLMRVAEAGLAALAGALGIAKKNDWGAYIREIEKELAGRTKASSARSTDEQFYAESAVVFDHLRRAWRNPTMHVDRSYSPERAADIFAAVKSFMSHLATRLKE